MADDDSAAPSVASDPSASPSAAPDGETPEDRQEAITEILAEVSDDDASDDASDEPSAEEEPESVDEAKEEELIDGFTPEQIAAMLGDDESTEPTGPDESADAEPAAPSPAGPPQAAQAVAASAPRALVAIHGAMLVVLVLGTWLTFRQVAGGLTTVAHALDTRKGMAAGGRQPAGGTEEQRGAASGDAGLRSVGGDGDVPRIDRGLRYVQKMDEGAQFFEKEQYAEAVAAYKSALAVMPPNWNDGAAAFRVGECYFRLLEYTKAIAAYQLVERATGTKCQARALFKRGSAHMAMKNYREARDAFYELLLRQDRYGPEAGPWIDRAYYRLADCYWFEAESLRPSTQEDAE